MADDKPHQNWIQRIDIEDRRRNHFIQEFLTPPQSSQIQHKNREFQNLFPKTIKQKLHSFVPGLYLRPHQRFANIDLISSTYFNASDPNSMRNFGQATFFEANIVENQFRNKQTNQHSSRQSQGNNLDKQTQNPPQSVSFMGEIRKQNNQQLASKQSERKYNQENAKGNTQPSNLSLQSNMSKERSFNALPKKQDLNYRLMKEKQLDDQNLNTSLKNLQLRTITETKEFDFNEKACKTQRDELKSNSPKNLLAYGAKNLTPKQQELQAILNSKSKENFGVQNLAFTTRNNQDQINILGENKQHLAQKISPTQVDDKNSLYKLIQEKQLMKQNSKQSLPHLNVNYQRAKQQQSQKYKKYQHKIQSDLQFNQRSSEIAFLEN